MKLGLMLAASLLPALSGCFGSDSADDQEGIRWGLGLDTSHVPPPAPLIENRTELAHLFAFANASIQPMFSRCGTTTSQESWVRGRAAASDLEAFVILREACDHTSFARAREEADAAIANGTEQALYDRYLNQLDTMRARVREKIHAMPAPGTYVDAEFQGALSRGFPETGFSRDFAVSDYRSYQANIGVQVNEANLDNALISLMGATRRLESGEHVLDHYQWQSGVCDVPTLEAEWAHLMAWFNRTLALAYERTEEYPEEREGGHSSMYGYLEATMLPRMQALYDEGLVLGLVRWRSELQFFEAYWVHHNRTVLPTADEAFYLVALHRSKVMSLTTRGIDDMEEGFIHTFGDDGHLWHEGHHAVRPLALQDVTWQYADLNCRPL